MIILRNARLLPVLTEGFEGNFADIILEMALSRKSKTQKPQKSLPGPMSLT